MKKLFEKYFYQTIAACLLLVVFLVLLMGYLVTNVFNAKSGYIGADKEIVMTTGDASMTLDEAIFLTKNKQAYYEAYYIAAGYTMNWDAKDKDGYVFSDVVLDESLQLVKEVFLFSEYAKSKGYKLSPDDLSAITANAKGFLNDSPDSIIKATGAHQELLERVYTRNAYYDMICEDIYKDTDLTVDKDEIRQCLVAVVEISPSVYTSPDRTAQKILERVNSGEVIGEVAKIYDAEAVKGNIGKGDKDGDALETLCLSLKDGECKMVEIDGTYYVVYCYLAFDEDATDQAKELKIDELKKEAKDAFFKELIKDMPIEVNEKVWSTITIKDTIFTEEDKKNSGLTK
ncbi:MAG: hypothetical protein IJV71_10530 [Lachnospiraceae bacterium]|nr:hypothetical protein [Lachnospiraceae bacterium]